MATTVDIYTRVSRRGSREHLTSPKDQEREARAFATSRGLPIGKVLHDGDESGGTLKRPGLQLARDRVESGESAGIVVAYLSRLSRDTTQGLELLQEVTAAGGTVYAPNLPENYRTSDGRMQTTIQLAIDTGYRERKSEEFERAKAGSIANGIPVHSRPPVGYRPREDRRLEPDPETAPAILEVFERRARGAGPSDLGTFLESRGVKTSQGSKTWRKQAIYGVLRNRIYLGELHYGRDRRYVHPTAHDPIVDIATWQAAQHPNGQLPPAGAKTARLLSGLLRCAGCRYCLQATTTSRGKRIYRCTRTHSGGVCPAPARVDAELVEDAAVRAFWTLTADLEAEGTKDNTGALTGLEKALERAEKLLTQVESADVQEALGERYVSVVLQRRKERDQAAEELGKARAETGATAAMPSAETLSKAWERMSVQERRELLALRFSCLALGRDRRLVVYPAWVDAGDLPRRGFKQAPELRPFADPPDGARVLTL